MLNQNNLIMNLPTSAKISKNFPNHTQSCINNFILLMELIMQSRTICLYKCRNKVQSIRKETHPQLNSCYVRLIRFFKMEYIEEFLMSIRITMLSLMEADLH